MNTIMASINMKPCSEEWSSSDYGTNANVPSFSAVGDYIYCAFSSDDRTSSSYSCTASTTADSQRLCYCVTAV